MAIEIRPRAHYLTELRNPAESPIPYASELIAVLPEPIKTTTGSIHSARVPQQGVCNLVLVVEADRGTFVLKVARGGYRSQELWAEHTVMQALHGGSVPVPRSLAYAQRDGLSFQLREYIAGEPLNAVLSADETVRPEAIRQMGETLAAIHAVPCDGEWTWEEWVEKSLERAALNLATGAYDPTDFVPNLPPPEALEWLKANRPPAGGAVCLLHGDYRPKNLLWQENRVVSVIDWAFADVGDPYYDLSILRWYMRDQAEWELFLASYGLTAFDQERFKYSMVLHTLLNV